MKLLFHYSIEFEAVGEQTERYKSNDSKES